MILSTSVYLIPKYFYHNMIFFDRNVKILYQDSATQNVDFNKKQN